MYVFNKAYLVMQNMPLSSSKHSLKQEGIVLIIISALCNTSCLLDVLGIEFMHRQNLEAGLFFSVKHFDF